MLRPARARPRSSRVGRFGPRSLTARLLAVTLIPMAGLQLFALREVDRQRKVASSADIAAEQMVILQRAGTVIVPLYFEHTATLGIGRAEALGLDRELVADVIGVDFITILTESRAELDEGLAALRAVAGDTVLATGETFDDALTTALEQLERVRSEFDGRRLDPDTVDGAFSALIDTLSELQATADRSLDSTAATPGLILIDRRVDHLHSALRHATLELRYLAEAGTLGSVNAPVMEMVMEAGAFDAAIHDFPEHLTAECLAELNEMLAGDSFADVARYRPDFVVRLVAADGGPVDVVADADTVQAIVNLLLASFDRLRDLQVFADDLLEEAVGDARRIADDAQGAHHLALAVMIAAAVTSLLLLGLVVRSILRPLKLLARKARQVQEGDLDVRASKPSGPTDIRVVMRSFNDMVTTLRGYDAQVQRLAAGDTRIDDSLPGALGETLRRSVSHLATVTHQLHESEAAANAQARTDSLTGLANRTRALEHLAEMALDARTTGRRGAVVFLDLDGFKSVNDSEGHAEGDYVLGQIGARLSDANRTHLVARIGGDEFVVLVADADNVDDVTILARDLIALISRPCNGLSGRLYSLSASAGVALVDGTRDPLAVVAQAGSAVYHAKERGRGRVEVFDNRLATEIEDRAEMALTMRQALADGQFNLALQPIIDVATMRPVGAEALLRWRRPGLGEVLPNDFIPIAERTDVILELERWVLEQAVVILREWRIDPATAHLRLAVNISGRHIIDGRLADFIEVLCRRAKIDPTLLDLEITETHLVADIARASGVVDDLREQGVKVAIDDFGTGYSSMGYLHRLTVDTLKIDQVFVAGMCDDRLDRSIVELLLRLGDSLGMRVVAEGVDSEDKLEALRAMGCHLAQGFHIARPMPVEDATQWLRARTGAAADA